MPAAKRKAKQQEHKVFIATSSMNPSVGQFRYRAFCKCQWDSGNTEDKESMDAAIDRHFQEHGAPVVISG